MAFLLCYGHEKDWDASVPLFLFDVHDSVQEALGFTPFELVFDHKKSAQLRGQLRGQ